MAALGNKAVVVMALGHCVGGAPALAEWETVE